MYHTAWMPEKRPCWTSEKNKFRFFRRFAIFLAEQTGFLVEPACFSGFSGFCRVEKDSPWVLSRIPSTGLDAASGDAHLST
jgi:hypothetical protein